MRAVERHDIQAALAALGADELREVVGELLRELDPPAHERVAGAILRRGARGGSGWVPAAVDDHEVAEAIAFAQALRSAGHADPAAVDDRLRRGVAAFGRKDYGAAQRMFAALLRTLSDGDIDLGQDELIDEVLSVDPHECALQYVVSTYMTTEPARRAEAVRAAMGEVSGVGFFFEPIQEMERTAVEALPGLADFLPAWRVIVEREAAAAPRTAWDGAADRWLREVIGRIEGSAGLAKVARATRRPEDLRAWCESLADAGDWTAALKAFAEAAELVTDGESARGGFLDGAALAAQEVGDQDVSPWLERAWRAQPTLPRLRRWLGGATTEPSLHQRVAEALHACPGQARRQRALLHVLQGDVERTAELLVEAPGLGWSDGEHPGALLFPLFQTLLGGHGAARGAGVSPGGGVDPEGLDLLDSADDDGPRLATPGVDALLRVAGVAGVSGARARHVVLAAMRQAAEERVAGVTGQKRRRHYGHAASLVAACVACDGSAETGRWVGALRERYRRFPALGAEFDRHLGPG